MGFRSGEYGGRNRSRAPLALMASRTAALLWLDKLSIITISPCLSVGQSISLTHAVKRSPLRGPSNTQGAAMPSCLRVSKEGHGLPVTMRCISFQPLAFSAPASCGGHIGLDPCLVQKDKTRGVEPALIRLPPIASCGNIRPFLLSREQAFF